MLGLARVAFSSAHLGSYNSFSCSYRMGGLYHISVIMAAALQRR